MAKSSEPTLITGYGIQWREDVIDWGDYGKCPKQLVGYHGKKEANAWELQGIYALYHNYDLVYVGKTDRQGLGVRIGHHRYDHLAERWNRFSWFATSPIPNSKQKTSKEKPRTIPDLSFEDIHGSFEAFGQLLAFPVLNRKMESIRGACEYRQEYYEPETSADVFAEVSGIKAEIASLAMKLDKLTKLAESWDD